MERLLIVGAGFSGAVLARELAEAGLRVDVFESRGRVAGNCYTEIDPETGITVHVHGPHIFHTDNEEVWNYVNRFGRMMPFINEVKAISRGKVYTLPVNLLTINQFFGTAMNPEEARQFMAAKAEPRDPIVSFEDQALAFVGREIYEAFFKGYTLKQWGLHPRELPASILKRLPLRFNYNANYFSHRYQGMPEIGYTEIIRGILDHDNINVILNRPYAAEDRINYDHIFYTGKLDAWFDYKVGYLGYRTLDFEVTRGRGDYQGCAVMNYTDEDVPYTRITEHKYFTPWRSFEDTIVYHERSRECGKNDLPYYPIRLVNEQAMLKAYVEMAQAEQGVTFVGRLATYRYLDMDVTVAEALSVARSYLAGKRDGRSVPPFVTLPL